MSLFGSILKVAGGFLAGGPAGAIAAGATLLARGTPATPARPTLLPAINRAGTFAGAPPVLRALPSLPGIGQVDSTKTVSGVQLWPGAVVGTTTTTYGGGGPKPGPQGCPVGYHFNRTTYYTAKGRVEKGTRCVKNRRRNPLNPRALSRSMSRIHSAKKAAHFLDRIQIGPRRRRKA